MSNEPIENQEQIMSNSLGRAESGSQQDNGQILIKQQNDESEQKPMKGGPPALPNAEGLDQLRHRIQKEIVQEEKDKDREQIRHRQQERGNVDLQNHVLGQSGSNHSNHFQNQFEQLSMMQSQKDQQEDLEIFRIVFELFDQDKNGYISHQDLLIIVEGYLYKGQQDIMNILTDIQRQNSSNGIEEQRPQPDSVSFGEFVTLIWSLEERRLEKQSQMYELSSIRNQSLMSPTKKGEYNL